MVAKGRDQAVSKGGDMVAGLLNRDRISTVLQLRDAFLNLK